MPPSPAVRVGCGISIGHYGEIFQGQIETGNNKCHRCLVSLSCNRFLSRAKFFSSEGGRLEAPPGKPKAEVALRVTLEHFKAEHIGGILTLDSNIPERKGCGSSTADCVAAVRALAASLGRHINDEAVARLVTHAEGASDNVMFRRAVLFAHREGTVLEDYLEPLPSLTVLGIDLDENAVVDTMSFPPADYTRGEIQTFNILSRSLSRAIRTRNLDLLGRIATTSATINERFLPKPKFFEITRLAHACGALGIAAAHSGTVLGILLDSSDPDLQRKVDVLRLQLSKQHIYPTMRFATGTSAFKHKNGPTISFSDPRHLPTRPDSARA